jgi:hypothetical protein
MSVGRFIVESINGRWIKLTTGVLNWNPFLGDKFVSYDDYKDIKAENERLRARVQMLEALICRIAKELPPGACSEATRSSIDGVVVGCNGPSRVHSI